MISLMLMIFSIFTMRRAFSPGSSIMLNPLMYSVSTKSSSINMPMGVMLKRSFLGFLLVVFMRVAVAKMRSMLNI